VNFEAYLSSKKIDSAAFKKAEPVLWDAWRKEFEQLHPNSFTAQKLYLINPIRRKYHQAIEALPEVLKSVETKLPATPIKPVETFVEGTGTEQPQPKPVVARPMMKPKLPISTPLPAGETTPAETPATPPPVKPAAAKPVIPKPVIKPKPVTDKSIKNEATPDTDIPAIESSAETKSEQAPVSKPMAKPVIPRPVIKPTSVADESIKREAVPTTDIPAETKSEQAPVNKPMVKPVIPRPVIKPKMPTPEVEQKPEQTTESLHDNTQATTSIQPSETPPAKAAKPAIPRPVIKPPKPKTD
jgi:hypothetical protein